MRTTVTKFGAEKFSGMYNSNCSSHIGFNVLNLTELVHWFNGNDSMYNVTNGLASPLEFLASSC